MGDTTSRPKCCTRYSSRVSQVMPGVGLTWDMGETRVRSQKSWVTGFQVGIGPVCRWGGVGSDTLDSGTISGGGAVSFMGVPGGVLPLAAPLFPSIFQQLIDVFWTKLISRWVVGWVSGEPVFASVCFRTTLAARMGTVRTCYF